MWTRKLPRGRIREGIVLVAGLAMTTAAWSQGNQGPTPPKVPFKNHPCESLSAGDEAALKIPSPIHTTPDRAPGTLASDNVCTYIHGGTRYVQIGYMTKRDYDLNNAGNRSTSHQAPSDLPAAFYDQQGGLWIAKNGYYVVVSGRSAMREPVARVIAGKL